MSIQLSGKYSFHQEPINCLNSGIKGLSFFNSRHLESVIQQLERIKENEVVAMATSLISSLLAPCLWNGKKKKKSLWKTPFQLSPAAKGISFRRCSSGLIGTCFWVCRYSFKSFAPGKAVFSTKLKRKERKSPELAASGWLSYTDVHFPRALVTDRTGLVRGPDGTVPGPDTILHSERRCCQVERNHILPHPKSPS